jgi:hypothetical protein
MAVSVFLVDSAHCSGRQHNLASAVLSFEALRFIVSSLFGVVLMLLRFAVASRLPSWNLANNQYSQR